MNANDDLNRDIESELIEAMREAIAWERGEVERPVFVVADISTSVVADDSAARPL